MDENLPVNKRPDYLEHAAKLKECQDFLVGQLGYRETYNKWCSYEFTTIFKKENIEIRIVFETSLPSSITMVDTELTYDESKGLTNVEYFATFNKAAFEVIKERLKNKESKK